jgi:hypothetical protein
MRKSRRLAVALAVSALVAAGGATAGLAASASARVEATCDGSATPQEWLVCQIDTQAIGTLSAITLVVTLKSGDGQNDQYIGVSWQGYCEPNGSLNSTTISPPTNPPPKMPISTAAPVNINIPLPYPDPRECDISADATLYASLGGGAYTQATTGSYQMEMEYTPWPSPSASSPAAVPLIRGYDGKCLDDKGNSAADRTEVIIWTCDSADPAQRWTFTGGELVHDAKCANDRANGGSGSKVILWTCNGAPDEMWTHPGSDGEFVLSSRSHGLLCLDDPGSATANRTQLIVSACRNTSNQHWT